MYDDFPINHNPVFCAYGDDTKKKCAAWRDGPDGEYTKKNPALNVIIANDHRIINA